MSAPDRSHHRLHEASLRTAAALLLCACGGAFTGCSSDSSPASSGDASRGPLRASDFASAESAAADTPPVAPAQTAAPLPAIATSTLPRSPAVELTAPRPARTGELSSADVAPTSVPGRSAEPRLTTTVGAPPAPDLAAPVRDVALAEALIGQVNGKPIFATEILEPLDGRLRQLGAQARNEGEWRRQADEVIKNALETRIQDELVLAEARRGLSPEQRQGLFRFLQKIQEDFVAGQRGSEVAADETLRESTGRGLREQAQDTLDLALIKKELDEKVRSRVNVSWRDIQQQYDRDFAKWHPPAVATLRLITADPRNPDAVATIQNALASGKPFAEVAKLEANTFNRAEGGKLERKIEGQISEGEYSPVVEINTAFRSLTEGQTAGPITYSTRPVLEGQTPDPANVRTAWVFFEKLERPEGTSLYEAQLAVERQLRNQRANEEGARYINRLVKRGNISDITEMKDRLLLIATDRYAARFNKKK